jgi:uncharacterized protein YdaU (DUF1376 family)
MAALPYMQLYVAEYLADTSHLNAAQHGAYLLLLMNYWQRGKALPDLNDRLATVARMGNEEWIANRAVLAEFFHIENGLWKHGRVERDLRRVKSISNAGRIGGIASAKARREKRLNGRLETVVRNANQQSINRIDKEQIKTTTPQSGFVLPDWVDSEAWQGFEEMRKKERHPLTDRARKLAIADLEKLVASGNDPVDVLNQSTLRGWRGLFALNGGSNGAIHTAGHETKYERNARIAAEQMDNGQTGFVG